MQRILISVLIAVILCTIFSFAAQAEITLMEYHALHLDEYCDTNSDDFSLRVYDRGFRQYGQKISSNGLLDPRVINAGTTTNVPTSGDVLVVFIRNRSLIFNGKPIFMYCYPDNYGHILFLDKLKNTLSVFPGKIVIVVNSDFCGPFYPDKPYNAAAIEFSQALAAAFPQPRYQLIVQIFVGSDYMPSCELPRALGFSNDAQKPIKKIYADVNGDRIVTAKEYHDFFLSNYSSEGIMLFTGEPDIPIYFANERTLAFPEKQHALNGRESFTIVPEIFPALPTDTFAWSTSNNKVATVKDGIVTGVAPGKADISLKVGGKTLKMAVTVKSVAATGIEIDKPVEDVFVGDVVRLTAALTPANHTDTISSWTSSNKSVATVDKYGVVRALRDGETVITLKTRLGQKKTYPLTVKKIPVTGVELDSNSPTYTHGTIGFSRTYTVHVTPENASFKDIRWISSNPSVASVSQSGKVSFKKAGSVVLTATSKDNPAAYSKISLNVRSNQHVWPAPDAASFTEMNAGLYASPKRLYYSGSTLTAEVYLFNHTASNLKSLPPFHAYLVDQSDGHMLYAKAVRSYTFSRRVAPEQYGVYRFSVFKKKIDLNACSDYAPTIIFQ